MNNETITGRFLSAKIFGANEGPWAPTYFAVRIGQGKATLTLVCDELPKFAAEYGADVVGKALSARRPALAGNRLPHPGPGPIRGWWNAWACDGLR